MAYATERNLISDISQLAERSNTMGSKFILCFAMADQFTCSEPGLPDYIFTFLSAVIFRM
jgi:hypothetical protein